MGNCSGCGVMTSAADDEDRGLVEPESVQRCTEGKARRALENLAANANRRNEDGELSSRVVKIKITRKQLQELLRRADAQGLLAAPHHALLADVVGGRAVRHARRSRKWRPRLQRIPEAAEHDEIDTP
ncbi:hypothetical protein MUK42_19216 [Musa troglodytarum]|uniref:Uncharacterized protein n=1 Tax=Musa troglodytarum TaxID=320322 RepID=A0A9E7ELZ6_9LILI|nr:hypothetical protein MUK42_19216 [Musa troglodytarum]